LAQTLPDEDVEDRGRNDILYQALDRPQYSGRVRARGFAVCPKDVFPPELPAAKQKTVDNIHAMYNRVIERLNILEREKEERQQASEAEAVEREQPVVKCQQPEAVEREQPSVKDSCNPVDFDTIPKVFTDSVHIPLFVVCFVFCFPCFVLFFVNFCNGSGDLINQNICSIPES
jgi:hypothetical protein